MRQISSLSSLLEKDAIHFIESNGLSVWWRDIENNSCWVSNKTAQLCGITQEVLMKNPNLWEEMIIPKDKIIFEQALEHCLEGYSTDVDYRIMHADGEILWIQERANPIKDENGKVLSISSIISDMTSQKNHGYLTGMPNRNHFKKHLSEQLENPLKLEMDLHKAIENNEFVLHYQPKVNLNTGKIVGVEALIRWNHPKKGMIPPNSFIPIAEETGLIIPIGKWALFEACKQNKRWQKKGFETVVSVNLSAIQFNQSNMVQTIAEVLHATKLNPKLLEIEITESMTANIEYAISTLKQLKYLGVQVSVDDFGTGFSSLNYLKELPIDTLKIDQTFVREIHKNFKGKIIIKTITSMAHNLNLNVIAEGIETKEQLVFLQQNLCNDGQGYFFSTPQTADKIEEKFHEIEQMVKKFGIPNNLNDNLRTETLFRKARKELEEADQLHRSILSLKGKISESLAHKAADLKT